MEEQKEEEQEQKEEDTNQDGGPPPAALSMVEAEEESEAKALSTETGDDDLHVVVWSFIKFTPSDSFAVMNVCRCNDDDLSVYS